MTIEEIIRRTGEFPATVESLERDLNALGVKSGQVLLVHSSLSSLGWVCGGPVAVVEALRAAVSPASTIVMPTHTGGLSDPSHWVNPPVPEAWWTSIRESMPAFDPRRTPLQGMGAIAECFRTFPGVERGDHPQLSFAAQGKHASEIVASHSLKDGLGENSPLGRLYETDASVLLLGVDHDRNTSLHLSEIRGLGDTLRTINDGAPILKDGRREWVEFESHEFDESDFVALGKAFVESTGKVQTGSVGMAQCQLMSQRAIVDFGIQWLESHRNDQAEH